MENSIRIDIRNSEVFYRKYQGFFPSKNVPDLLKLDLQKPAGRLIDELALFALKRATTLPILYSFQPLFLELVARWIIKGDELEKLYLAIEGPIQKADYTIQGSIILSAMSRLVGISEESMSLIEYFLDGNDFFGRIKQFVGESKSSISSVELESILLAFFRLGSWDQKFDKFIDPQVLYEILNIPEARFNVAKLLAIYVLTRYLNASEKSQDEMIQAFLGDEFDATSSYETDFSVDYTFLHLVEAERLSNFSRLPPFSIPSSRLGGEFLVVKEDDLSPLIISVCSILIPRLNETGDQNLIEPALSSVMVPTEGTVEVLKQLAHNVQRNKPSLLYGDAGLGKTFFISQVAKLMLYQKSIVKIHLGEETDAKLLLGTYTSGEKPGTFEWRAGVLTLAVKEGKWVVIEDIDAAPTEVLSVLLTLLEKRELSLPSRGEIIKAKNGFQMIATIRTSSNNEKGFVSDLVGLRLWNLIKVTAPSDFDLKNIISSRFHLLRNLSFKFINCYKAIHKTYGSPSFIALNRGSHPRGVSVRDLMKFCSRCSQMMQNEGIKSPDQLFELHIFDNIFAEAVDCFGGALTEASALSGLIDVIGKALETPPSRIDLFMKKHVPRLIDDDDKLKIGRATLEKVKSEQAISLRRKNNKHTSFAQTNYALRLMEQIGVAIQMVEPVLLVGETGTGKTTIVQQIAKMMGKKLTVINVSQQTEVSDLLGGFKPVNTKTIAVPLQESFEALFLATFSKKRNERFSQILSKCFNKSQWQNVARLWKEAVKMARDLLEKKEDSPETDQTPRKKRKLGSHEKLMLLEKWNKFEVDMKEFEIQASSLESSFVFNFIEGSLVSAVKNGEWLLLDEINLASSDTLESISELLSEVQEQRSVLLTERGDTESIIAHPDFRIFGCMNPSTDVGKKELPVGIRTRFSEIYVHSPDRDIQDLLSIIDKYIGRYAIGDEWVGNDIAELYMETKKLSETNMIVDGANQRPHFSIRTLTRTLIYVCDIISIYGLRRSLYEGFCMSFLTLLDIKSEQILQPLIVKFTIGRMKNMKSVLSQSPPKPSSSEKFVAFKHYWLRKGNEEPLPQPHYIITPFVEKNMLNLVRASSVKRFPVLIQGPTSAGKTSMIKYLANLTGHQFVRINNHEHTDLQEYLGTYVSDSSGKLTFKEGVLVQALRRGDWIVLDELNLAPTDVLEALNRLLDDNRELFIPETQEVVRPHPNFMLFATQNPPGLYGGRKVLSRAFRNRFLELHFDDIPEDELEIILRERCQIAPSYGKKMVEVYRQLSLQRQSTRLFEQKNSFATLRDLFRWALRDAVGYEELAANGYMLLAERVRKSEERQVVKKVIEKVMRVKLDMDAYYSKLEDKEIFESSNSVVWTKAMRRLAVLVSSAIKYKEPLLLVGETGCGKTTICQVIAQFSNIGLVTVNAHQNTETGDLLGAQRPVRNRFEAQGHLYQDIQSLISDMNFESDIKELSLEQLIKLFRSISKNLDSEVVQNIESRIKEASILFEWSDGPLIQAMKNGSFFLLDEISLADDSVLERLNSVLEPERSLLLAEKGSEDANIVAEESFQFLATMNPGGDYGKKELSPALRNRFTEIWVPSMENFDDVKQIVRSKLSTEVKAYTDSLVEFSRWFSESQAGGISRSGIISLRDILSWVRFMNSSRQNVGHEVSFLHGACMTFIDTLGTNNTAYMAENEETLNALKQECVQKLGQLANADLLSHYNADLPIVFSAANFHCGPFSVPRSTGSLGGDSFNLHAPTTAKNAMRVIRALQVHKSILLEGSPGVGKTSLVAAIAKAVGAKLHRINLSEQTDLIDLFGSDAPAEGGKAGEFVWRDAPFLRAMQKGEWVLLDEMNLASQSVLEGLNACLDHRGEAYIPELDKSFKSHPDFVVFAAQNPQYQGGGRKGLPKSFVNRFSVVYVDTLKAEDLNMISQHLYPNVSQEISEKLIKFMSLLEKEVVVEKNWGATGSPWEFNLRDTLRWLELFNSPGLPRSLSPSDFYDMIIRERFRTSQDRTKALELFTSIFDYHQKDNVYNIGLGFVQARGAIIKRREYLQYISSPRLIPLLCNFIHLETAIHCVNHNLPLILVGPSNAGKTSLLRFLGTIVGAQVVEFPMNSEVDSMDILGGYEQVDLARKMSSLVEGLKSVLVDLVLHNLTITKTHGFITTTLEFISYLSNFTMELDQFPSFYKFFENFLNLYSDDRLLELFEKSLALKGKINEQKEMRFEWFDGLLVQAVEKGQWLVLDNANLCSLSVLDRLNSLLETNGNLIINECSSSDGQARLLKPHPNFRLFLTMDPKYGELSRAMRNRGIEVFMDALPTRSSDFDLECLNLNAPFKDYEVTERLKQLKTTDSIEKPVLSFLSSTCSKMRFFGVISDILHRLDVNDAEIVNVVLSLLPLMNLRSMIAWVNLVRDSSEFGATHKEVAEQIGALYKIVNCFELDSIILSLYTETDKRLERLLNGVSNYSQFISIQPNLNSYVVSSLVSSYPFINSIEAIKVFQVLERYLRTSNVITLIKERASSIKINELSDVEKCAAIALGRNVKYAPRLKIFSLIEKFQRVIAQVILTKLSSIFQTPQAFEALFDLQLILLGIISVSNTENLTKIRVYKDLISEWVERNQVTLFSDEVIENIAQISEFLGERLHLSTGLSIEVIWDHFRGYYAQSDNGWKKVRLLHLLVDDFEIVSKELFPDSLEYVIELQSSIAQVHDEVIQDSISDADFDTFCNHFTEGIIKLKDISGSFIFKRSRILKDEFYLLANFLLGTSKNQDAAKLHSLTALSDRSLLPSYNHSDDSQFRPYPSIFDYFWVQSNNESFSMVDGYFSNTLLSNTIQKCQELVSSTGKSLIQNTVDFKIYGKELILCSKEVLGDKIVEFKKLMYKWYSKLLLAHAQNIPGIESTVSHLTETSNLDRDAIALLSDITQTTQNSSFILISREFLFPALGLISKGDLLNLGKAWVIFSCGAIQLYVPSSAHDPAIKDHIIYERIKSHQKHSAEVVRAWRTSREVFSGDDNIHLEDMLPEVQNSNFIKKPKVFRPSTSIDSLFEEWSSFMESTIDVDNLMNLLNAVVESKEMSTEMVKMFQNSALQFSSRLIRNYLVYSDLNDILQGLVFGLRLGFDIIQIGKLNQTANCSLDRLWMIDLQDLSLPMHVANTYEIIKDFNRSQSSDSVISELNSVFFIKLCFAHDAHLNENNLSPVLLDAFQMLYHRWFLRNMKAQEANETESKLYKYNDPESNVEDDFNALFPDHEDFVDVSVGTSKTNSSFEEIYYSLAKLYIDSFVFRKAFSVEELIADGDKLFGVLSKFSSEFKQGINTPSLLCGVISSLKTSIEKTKDEKEIDFYHEGSPSEFSKAVSICTSIYLFAKKLFVQWPEHDTIQSIIRVSNEFMNFPMHTSLSRLLQKIEQVYTYIAEWEKYAHSGVSFKLHFDDLTNLIISWRRLELRSWKELFNNEDIAIEKGIGKWWFHLFEVILVPILNGEEEDDAIPKIISALNLFMSQALYGDYLTRLNLLEAFLNHVKLLQNGKRLHSSLSNFVYFYGMFSEAVSENIVKTKKVLEKEIQEVILLASWKDVNIDALKQTSRRSHNNLFKIVRKYRSLLNTQVQPVIEQGMHQFKTPSLKELPLIEYQIIDGNSVSALCQKIPTWTERPQRLKNLSMIETNMGIYVSKVKDEIVPDLKDFASELVVEMNKLRKETPEILTEENKKQVAALKSQKRKLLSDTLKELRRIGVRTTVKSDIHKFQASVNLILSNSKSFSGSMLQDCDSCYFQLLELLPRLRAAVSSPSEDVPLSDIEKGMNAAENLIFSLITIREPFLKFANSTTSLVEDYKSISKIAGLLGTSNKLVKASMFESVALGLKEIKSCLMWLPKLLDFASSIVSSSSVFSCTADVSVFEKAKAEFFKYEEVIKYVVESALSSNEVELIESFKHFYLGLIEKLTSWKDSNEKFGFVADVVIEWMTSKKSFLFLLSSTSPGSFKSVEDIEIAFRRLSNYILLSFQKTMEIQSIKVVEGDDSWLKSAQEKVVKYVKEIRTVAIEKQIKECLHLISRFESDSENSELVSAICAFTLPVVHHYIQMLSIVLQNVRKNYMNTSNAALSLCSTLYHLAAKGFCSPEPPSNETQNDNLEDGTGLGDGDGAKNNSNDTEQDDDLTEEAQTNNNEKGDDDRDEEKDEDDAIEMEGDMAGDLEEASNQDSEADEEDERDLDEEIDDIDDLDPNAVDDKMWDEKAQEGSKEKESDNVPENNTNQDENLEAQEDSDDKAEQKIEDSNNNEEENADGSEGESGDEEDVGEQEDDVRNEENEQLEKNVAEKEALDLPDDINLDSGDEEDNKSEDNDEFNDKMDVDEEKVEKEESDPNDKEKEDVENEESMNMDNDEGESNDAEEESNDIEEETKEDQMDPDPENNDSEEETARDYRDEEKGDENEDKEEERGKDSIEGGADTEGADQEKLDNDSNVKQEFGERGEGADNQVLEEENDVGANGGASVQTEEMKSDAPEEHQDQKEEARNLAKESLKQLGDALKEFHRRREDIKEASSDDDDQMEKQKQEHVEDFEHIKGENTDYDTQALGAAEEMQTHSIDESKAIDEVENNQDTLDIKEEEKNDEDVVNEDDLVIENEEKSDELETKESEQSDVDMESGNKISLGGAPEERLEMNDQDDLQEEVEEDNKMHVDATENLSKEEPTLSIEEARDLWRRSDLATQELASGLCEQLRLILEPTLATKLKGDYKTGKRLNMKRIIPYIASEFRKDKIWLRRTKPSKRQYQVMLAIDDSKSMSESKSTELAFHSVALVCKALTQLESGGLSIVRFGEDLKVVHSFDKTFNTHESGPRIFQWFDFQQTRTDIKMLCEQSLKIFEQNKGSTSADLWQLQIIISDGVCEDHDTLKRLVRKARDEKIMLVFVVIDGINSNESILDMSQVTYETDPMTGAMNLKVNRYLESFPFEFYVVVKNIKELPEMLSLILRQYFTEVASI